MADFPLTLKELQACYVMCGALFLARLVATVLAVYPDSTDQQIAEGVTLAWRAKKHQQRGEGLFLVTVPAAMAAIHKVKALPPGPVIRDAARQNIETVGDVLRSKGAEFAGHCGDVWHLLSRLTKSEYTAADLQAIEISMERIESDILATANRVYGKHPNVIAAVDSVVPALLNRDNGRTRSLAAQGFGPSDLPKELVRDAKASAAKTAVLELLGLPRLSLFL